MIRHCEPTGPARSGRPDDKLREAIQGRLRKNLDCFVADAPRNDEAFILSREAGRVTARSAVGRGLWRHSQAQRRSPD